MIRLPNMYATPAHLHVHARDNRSVLNRVATPAKFGNIPVLQPLGGVCGSLVNAITLSILCVLTRLKLCDFSSGGGAGVGGSGNGEERVTKRNFWNFNSNCSKES